MCLTCGTGHLPVSMVLSAEEVAVFQNRMQRSAVPPPDARRPCWWGDQAMALTAAEWSVKRSTGVEECRFQMKSWLSLPPLAISRSSGDHFSPHTCGLKQGVNNRFWPGVRCCEAKFQVLCRCFLFGQGFRKK